MHKVEVTAQDDPTTHLHLGMAASTNPGSNLESTPDNQLHELIARQYVS